MCTQDKEADRHRTIGLIQLDIIAREEFIECDEVPQGLPHLLSVDGDHIIMHPVANHLSTVLRSSSLSDFTLVVREDEIHPSTMDIELLT